MSIRQLTYRCWELNNPADDERTIHKGTEADIRAALNDIKAECPDSTASVHLLDAPCWVAECDGECDSALDQEGECWTFHCQSQASAIALADDYEWLVKPGPLSATGMLAYCPEDAPGDGQVPPPTPEQQEAAGQMRLPGMGAAT